MADLSKEDEIFLLRLARAAIASRLNVVNLARETEASSVFLREKRGCFVTLHKKGMLRGCIGTIKPEKPLFIAVQDNAIHAAFHDSRFERLSEKEFEDVEIEISILSAPEVLSYVSPEELKARLKPNVHGVILSKNWNRATYLPQVWNQLPDVESFLENLCKKAGMGKDCWKEDGVTVEVYTVTHFTESGFKGI